MNKYDSAYLRTKNVIKCYFHSVKLSIDSPKKKILRQNKALHNRYKGKRCFIVGCGPSLNELDLSLIKNEYTFTVNYFMKSPLYSIVNSDFHILMDPLDFVDDRISELSGINYKDKKPLCFMPLQSVQKVEALELNHTLDIRYLYCCYSMYEKFNKRIDISKVAPTFPNSVLYCTMVAIYMGFKEIIYIGCDMTGYEQLSVIAGKEVKLHVYEMDEEEKQRIRETHQIIDNEAFFCGFMNTFAGFRKFREYAERHSVKLLNATKGGVLNEIERINYELLFH